MGDYDKDATKAPTKTKAAPTAGPAQDDRFGSGKIASNLTARIIKVDIVGGMPMITIASGTTRGTHAGMEGYIKAGADLMLADFQIHEAREGVSFAFLPDLERKDIEGYLNVVINPSARPSPPSGDVKTRVIQVDVISRGTRITIPRGKIHGIKEGTTGDLLAKDGGRSFTIDHVELTRAHAVLDETPDYITANPDVMLHVQPKSSRRAGGPVQRRANGASSSSADVQSTADAGVAGASSRLPFFDVIQRSFGKHDISGVRAQVGGAATEASSALGAQAYATGNRVAFASAPDLHTAAHEAAHTVQQSRGAVGFQGLGAADDEHERHADAVADAVVAGQTAEPLLDRHAGGRSSNAVQRKEAAAGTRPKQDDERTEARAIVTSLNAGQYELDQDHGARDAQADRAMLHVRHAMAAAKRFETSEDPSVVRAVNSFDQSLLRFAERARLATRQVRQLIALNSALRDRLGVSTRSAASDRHDVGGTQKSHCASALPSAIGLITSRCEAAKQRLDGLEPNSQHQRLAIVSGLSDDLDESISYVQALLDALPQRPDVAAELNGAADKVSYILRWIRTRTGYARMEQRYMRSVHGFDSVLLSARLPTIESREHAILTERGLDSGKAEAATLTVALSHFDRVLAAWGARQESAVHAFGDLAALTDEDEPSFIAEMLKAVFVAALGHFGGYLLGAATAKATPSIGRVARIPALGEGSKATEEIVRRVVDVSTDSIQSIAGKALEETKTDAQAHARAFFLAGMRINVADRILAYRENVTSMAATGEVGTNEVNVISAVFESLKEGAYRAFLRETARAWAQYVVQSRLKPKNRLATGSDMKNYFGEQRSDGVRVHGTSKAHGAGVFSIRMVVNPAGTKPKIDHTATQILRMNSEVKQAVLEGAAFKLDDIQLPKEVNVTTDYGRAVIALDERNNVRDVIGWDEVQRKVGVESGAKFWRLWGKGLLLK